MKYLQRQFSLPVSDGISQEDWDKIFSGLGNELYEPDEEYKDWLDEDETLIVHVPIPLVAQIEVSEEQFRSHSCGVMIECRFSETLQCWIPCEEDDGA